MLSHISRRALQGYETYGLIKPSKNKMGYNMYDEKQLKRIQKIKLFQDFGFSLKEIVQLIDSMDSIQQQLEEKREQLVCKKEELETTIIKIEEWIQALD